jgi:hypothetical protein
MEGCSHLISDVLRIGRVGSIEAGGIGAGGIQSGGIGGGGIEFQDGFQLIFNV